MAARPILEAYGVTMRFEGVTALENVDFQLGARELRCLIGPNGAGKSTFFKCVTGLHVPTEGQVHILGHETTGMPPHWIAGLGVGIKTQVPSVMQELTARENIWLAARRRNPARVANRIAADTLDRLELGDIADATLATLAHGKRQLVEFGIVLAGQPKLILLDEPAAGLTADEVERAIGIIREMNETAAMVIVEHDMHFVRAIADTITVFHRGRVLMEAHVDTVMNDPTVRDVYLGKQQ